MRGLIRGAALGAIGAWIISSAWGPDAYNLLVIGLLGVVIFFLSFISLEPEATDYTSAMRKQAGYQEPAANFATIEAQRASSDKSTGGLGFFVMIAIIVILLWPTRSHYVDSVKDSFENATTQVVSNTTSNLAIHQGV